jgi:hypothetical protein
VLPVPGGSDDPTQVGASITIEAFPGGATVTFPLPASHWTVETPKTAFKFENPGAPNALSPVRSALLRKRVLKLKSLSLGLPLDEPGQTYLVRLSAGSSTWCSSFSSPQRDRIGVFLARRQETAPESCDLATTTTSTTSSTSTSSNTTTTTIGTCGCGDGVCQATEDGASCPEDCLLARRPTLPLLISDCAFDAYRLSGDCGDVPMTLSVPGDLGCWTTLLTSGESPDLIALLPEVCCAGGVCGGGRMDEVRIGDSVPSYNGQLSAVFQILKDCVVNHALTDWVVPLVECNADGCAGDHVVSGFATVHINDVVVTGAPKGIQLDSVCSFTSPCGLGTCGGSATCETCPEDCGGCAPPCP